MKSYLIRSTMFALPMVVATAAFAQTATTPAPAGGAMAPTAHSTMAPAAGSTMAPTASASATAPATDAKLTKADREFVTKAAEGGAAEVQMAQLALQKTQSDSVKKFAQGMIDDHTPANAKLASIATSKGMTAPTDPSAAQQKMLAKLQGMDGKAFDHAYISGQIKAHQAMLKVFSRESTVGKDADLRAFADATTPVIQKHVNMAQNVKG